jgi:hypothetical protein
MISDWTQISPALFEKLSAAVLRNVGFTNIQWYGSAGSDKGRDIIAEKLDSPVPGVERREKWLIQCKRYTQKALSKGELKDLLDSALEHLIDNVLIIVTSSVSANLRDWMEGALGKYPFKAYLWEEIDFRREINKHRVELMEAVPELMEGKEPLWFYPMNQNEIRLVCNDFEEVEIVVVNTDNVEDAKKKAGEFLYYLKTNGFEWWN